MKPAEQLVKLAAQYDAQIVRTPAEANEHRDKAIAYETQDFGYVLSAVLANGSRILLDKV